MREAIATRYSFLPYLYELMRRASLWHEPIMRPPFLDHEHDERAWEASHDFLLGESLLVASVVERGQRTRTVYLPDNRGRGWWDWHSGIWYEGGQEISLPAPLERCPLLARGGSLIVRSRGLRLEEGSKISANGAAGGSVRVAVCADSAEDLRLDGTLEARGENGRGGAVLLETRGAKLGTRPPIAVGGASGDGVAEVVEWLHDAAA